MPRFIRIEKSDSGRTRVYVLGVKVFSFGLRVKTSYTLKEIDKIQQTYARIEKRLYRKAARGKKIKVAFLVSLSSMFPARPLLDCMMKNKGFDVSLIILPDVRFDTEANLKKTIEDLAVYQSIMHVVPAREEDDKLNLPMLADIVIPALPYDDVTHPKYRLFNLIKKGMLPAYVNYAYFRSTFERIHLIPSDRYSLFWKIFVESEYNLNEYKNYQKIKGRNAILTGYCKMDSLSGVLADTPRRDRKTILISPHHTVAGGFNDALGLSNFEKYAELFLSLPDAYPQLDFIFRPHPALFPCLEKEQFWGKEKVMQYNEAMRSKRNVIYSDRGDYFQDFAASDGIIQDCGSYLVEYFYTKKPCCYMLKEPADIESKFAELGQMCLKNCYLAYNEDAIRNFVERVIIAGHDPLKDSREQFAEERVMLNYPHAAEEIYAHLAEVFNIKNNK